MNWLNKVVDQIEAAHPEGEILIESGHSPSGTYHLGHLRELITCDAILTELQRRGRNAKHISFVDDLDALRKIPTNVPAEYEKYLGQSLCDIPAPSGGKGSYADYFLQDLIDCARALNIKVDFERAHKKYQAGFFTEAIEKALANISQIRQVIEMVSGRKLDETWSPIQVNEGGYLKKRSFVSLDAESKTIEYLDKDGKQQKIAYGRGEVKLDWRIDWPARWWLLKVAVEPFGRDHATKGGSYDTGAAIVKAVFKAEPPMPVPYDFVNMAGDTKKMSASKGTGLDAITVVKVLPPEIVRFFMLRYPPSKRLYFDSHSGVSQLIDEFAELLAKTDKSESETQLIEVCTKGLDPTVSNVPFSHLVASYQAGLKDPAKTMEIIERTEHKAIADGQKAVIRKELGYIDQWLQNWAPEEVKFELLPKVTVSKFSASEKKLLQSLAGEIAKLPADADGEAFHKAIYGLKESVGAEPKQVFSALYKALIGKEQGPRAGWFLSILPRDWLIKRLRLEA